MARAAWPATPDDPEPPASEGPPPAPSLPGAVRAGLVDVYFNSWRLVPANLAFGLLLLAILVLAASVSGLALLALPVLALPVAGVHRVAALAARGRLVSLADGFRAWRTHGVAALLLGLLLAGAATVLGTNVVQGLLAADLPGMALATAAGWGLVAVAMLAVVAWPLLVDPDRDDRPAAARLRLAALLALAHPGRILALAALVVVVLAVSTAAFVALLTISIGIVACVAARYVLPAADRLEARLATRDAARRAPAPPSASP